MLLVNSYNPNAFFMKSLLVPVDFSAHSVQAVTYAAGLAAELGYRIHLLHVSHIPMPSVASPMYGASVPMIGVESMIKEIRHEAQESMKTLINDQAAEFEKIGYHGPVFQTILEGDACEEIEHWIEVHSPAGLILGVTPRSTMYRVFIGSVAGKLLHKVKVPVIAVPSGASYLGVDKVVFASDFDPEDQALWTKMNEFLGHKCQNWHIVHMVTDLEEHYFFDKEKELEDRLRTKWITNTQYCEIKVNVFSEGALLSEVEKYANAQEAGMIAFVSHRRNMLSRVIEPSVSTEAMFHLHRPMLFLHTEDVRRTDIT